MIPSLFTNEIGLLMMRSERIRCHPSTVFAFHDASDRQFLLAEVPLIFPTTFYPRPAMKIEAQYSKRRFYSWVMSIRTSVCCFRKTESSHIERAVIELGFADIIIFG